MLNFINYDKNGLLISLAGKINAENARELSDDLLKIREKYPEGRVVIDTLDLGYISSAGLRVLLNLSKSEKEKPVLINVDASFMDILEDTGFTRLFDVHKQIKTISIDGCELIGKGANGEVYKLSEEQVVKVFKEGVPLLYGLPTAITFAVVKIGERYGSVFELLNARSLSGTINDDPAAFDTYKDEYVRIFKMLHSTVVDVSEFPAVKDVYRGYIDDCEGWYRQNSQRGQGEC